MEIFQAVILGIVQGASEFLPISSSGHLIIVPEIFGWSGVVDSLSFDVALHMATSVALIIFFWSDWLRLSKAFVKNLPLGFSAVWKSPDSRLLLLLLIGSLPAAFFGLLFQDFIEQKTRSSVLVAFLLIIFALVLFGADRIGKKNREEGSLGFLDSLLIGFAQAIALLPGVSRSGITISAGLVRNLTRVEAAKFSFMLSTPAILGATLLKSGDILNTVGNGSTEIFIAGFFAAVASSLLAIKVLLSFVQKQTFTLFVIYRIILGLTIIAFFR